MTFYNIFNYIILIPHEIMVYFNRYRIINDRVDKEPYLERYYIFLKDRTKFPFNIFIHKFLKSDSEDLHDHPLGFISVPLWQGYWEHTKKGKFWRKPFSFRYAPAETLHRVELNKDYNYCWTLFIPCNHKREWGFETNNGWIHNEEYLKKKN